MMDNILAKKCVLGGTDAIIISIALVDFSSIISVPINCSAIVIKIKIGIITAVDKADIMDWSSVSSALGSLMNSTLASPSSISGTSLSMLCLIRCKVGKKL